MQAQIPQLLGILLTQMERVNRLVTDGVTLDAVTRYPDVYTPPLQDEVQPRQCATLLYVYTPEVIT